MKEKVILEFTFHKVFSDVFPLILNAQPLTFILTASKVY